MIEGGGGDVHCMSGVLSSELRCDRIRNQQKM